MREPSSFLSRQCHAIRKGIPSPSSWMMKEKSNSGGSFSIVPSSTSGSSRQVLNLVIVWSWRACKEFDLALPSRSLLLTAARKA